MAKRGQFYPYRIEFWYPNNVSGSVALMSVADVHREGKGFLRRGADIHVLAVDEATRRRRSVCKLTPADLPDEEES